MKFVLKRILAAVLVAVITLSVCSCSPFEADIDSLITPPNPSGELGEIKRTLDKFIAPSAQVKHPTEGEYLSPIVTKDIDGDGVDEAFAFYATTDDSKITMHMTFIGKDDDEWSVKSDSAVSAAGITKLSFADIDGDGTLEPIAGWSLYGDTDIAVTVHDLTDDVLVQRMSERCSFFLVCDLDGDGTENIITNHLSTADKTAVAKVFSMTTSGVTELGSCSLDGGVNSYNTPIVSTLTDGRPAVYLDAVKGKGMITEVIFFDNGHLKNGFIDTATLVTSATWRDTMATLYDFNSDSIPEIPLTTVLPTTAVGEENVYITRWCSFDGSDMFVTATALMNYADGYYILLPEKLKTVPFTITRRIDMRLRTVYLWNEEEGTEGAELLRIKAVARDEWDKNKAARGEYTEVNRNESTVIAVMISSYAGQEAITANETKKMIGFIK